MTSRSYTELAKLRTFHDRFQYLKLHAGVGRETFGFERYLNQSFYKSAEWRNIREHVILRDNGCDLGVPGLDIFDRVIVHHMNPMEVLDIVEHRKDILNPEYLISTTHETHNAIHYGTDIPTLETWDERRPGDTNLW